MLTVVGRSCLQPVLPFKSQFTFLTHLENCWVLSSNQMLLPMNLLSCGEDCNLHKICYFTSYNQYPIHNNKFRTNFSSLKCLCRSKIFKPIKSHNFGKINISAWFWYTNRVMINVVCFINNVLSIILYHLQLFVVDCSGCIFAAPCASHHLASICNTILY